MRAALFCCLITILSQLPALAKSSEGLSSITLHGNEYASLEKWAKSYEMEYTPGEDLAVVTNHFAKMIFPAHSRKISLNGVTLYLSHMVATHGSGFYVSVMDLEKLLNPILYPPREDGKITTVWIDAGHGGKDPGNLEKRAKEKYYTLLLAKQLQDILKREGLKVLMSRSSDKTVNLYDRPAAANRSGADVFVSLHFNSAGDRNAQGVETFCVTPSGALSTNMRPDPGGKSWTRGNKNDEKNAVLAYQVQKALTRNLDVVDRGVKRARFVVIKDAAMPAILVEGGFMTNPTDRKHMEDPDFRNKMASSIAIGVMAFKRVMERP